MWESAPATQQQPCGTREDPSLSSLSPAETVSGALGCSFQELLARQGSTKLGFPKKPTLPQAHQPGTPVKRAVRGLGDNTPLTAAEARGTGSVSATGGVLGSSGSQRWECVH